MYNLNPYMCNYVVFNCTMHMYGLYTSVYIYIYIFKVIVERKSFFFFLRMRENLIKLYN